MYTLHYCYYYDAYFFWFYWRVQIISKIYKQWFN